MKYGLILINAYAKAESELNSAYRLKEELESFGAKVEISRNLLSAGVIKGKIEKYLQADFCIYLDKDRYAGEMLERAGLRLFNRPQAIADCDDKMRTCLALNGFPMPDTISAPLCYLPNEPLKEEIVDGVVSRLGLPVIVKECFGSLGKGVYKADTIDELSELCEKLKCKPHLFQLRHQRGVLPLRHTAVGRAVAIFPRPRQKYHRRHKRQVRSVGHKRHRAGRK